MTMGLCSVAVDFSPPIPRFPDGAKQAVTSNDHGAIPGHSNQSGKAVGILRRNPSAKTTKIVFRSCPAHPSHIVVTLASESLFRNPFSEAT
jgi:hypothetical protein